MLYNLLAPFAEDYIFFNLFRYLTFRTGGAILTALVISFIIAPPMIRWLKKKQKEGQPIRKDGPETHFAKAGTPTMGGFIKSIYLVCLVGHDWVWPDWLWR